MAGDLETTSSWLVQQWADGIADVIGTLVSSRPSVAFQLVNVQGDTARVRAISVDCVWWQQTLDVLTEPAIWIGATPDAHKRLARLVLERLAVDARSEADIDATWLDLISQASNVLTQRIAQAHKERFTCSSLEPAPSPTDAAVGVATVTMDGGEPIVIRVGFSRQMVERMAALPAPGMPAEAGPMAPPAGLDVHLEMIVTLGRTTMPLGDIFQLSRGAIIEFPQTITQPAEVLINGKLVGHGQVVVLDGSYAVKLISTTFRGSGGSF